LRELHESQLKGYQDAARAALSEHAQSVSLPDVPDDMEEEVYIQKIITDLERPDWKVDEVLLEEAWMAPLRERARAAFEENDNGDDDDEEEMEDGEEEEEGEEKPIKPATKKLTVKKRTVTTKAGKGLLKKKALSAAKTGSVAGQRASRGRRARRGGRGGAGAAK